MPSAARIGVNMKKTILLGLSLLAISTGAFAATNRQADRDTIRQFLAPCSLLGFSHSDMIISEIEMYVTQGFKVVSITKIDSVSETEQVAPNSCIYTFVRQ